MWLLDVETLDLHQFVGDSIPAYAILSHTWGLEEVGFSEMIKPKHLESAQRQSGFHKIAMCCAQAQRDGYNWALVDTCCIDKRSSAELSEAINSMFECTNVPAAAMSICPTLRVVTRPFRCLVIVDGSHAAGPCKNCLPPRKLFSSQRIGLPSAQAIDLLSHIDLADDVSKITGIPTDFLISKKGLWQTLVAPRISWASRRKTTREEDHAYSLMGMFDISMPILYGEGLEKAFARLQHEIMRKNPDQSILSWYHADATSNRLPADSPDCFQNSGNVMPLTGERLSTSGKS
jgi:hypothetical protein